MSDAVPRPKKIGRPRTEDGPKLPRKATVKLLIEGELVPGPNGTPTRQWPTQRQLAQRFGVAPSLIGELALREKISARRAEFVSLMNLTAAPGEAKLTVEPRQGKLGTSAVNEFAKKVTARAPRPPKAAAPRRAPSSASPGAGRPGGRPRKGDEPALPYEELDRALVFGELIPLPDGGSTTVFPRYRELATRYGVSLATIASYAKSHNCMRRRASAQSRIASQAEKKLVELRAGAVAVGKGDVIRIIDTYLVSFEKALSEGRVRTDNPSDLNTLVRLKEFVMGGADGRQELNTSISLASLQEAHAQMLRLRHQLTPAMTGRVESRVITLREPSAPGADPEPDSARRLLLGAQSTATLAFPGNKHSAHPATLAPLRPPSASPEKSPETKHEPTAHTRSLSPTQSLESSADSGTSGVSPAPRPFASTDEGVTLESFQETSSGAFERPREDE